MAAPERFAESQIPLALRAPSIHGPSRHIALPHELGRYRGKADIAFRRITPPCLWVHGLVCLASDPRSRSNLRLGLMLSRKARSPSMLMATP